MSAKGKKSAAAAATSSSGSGSGTQTPQSSSTPRPGSRPASSLGARAATPMSPTRQTRLQEKADLQNLNDRLAAYIDRVRQLETDNGRLSREVQNSQELITREITTYKDAYERELGDARRMLDETAREKAKIEIDNKRLLEESDDLRKRLDKKTKDLVNSENAARMFENRASEFSNKYNIAVSERKKAADDAAELAKEVDKLRKQLADTRKIQEEETLCRIELENTVQSLKEELQFKEHIHKQEVTEVRSRRQVEISEIDGKLAEQYETKLQITLQELRDQQEAQIRLNRDELEARYENKLQALQSAANRNSNATGLAVDELRLARTQVEGLNTRITDLENQNTLLNGRIRELEKTLQGERARHAGDLAQLENELSALREKMAEQLREYSLLMDIKTSLDLEIATYRVLLEGEEDRLNLSSGSPEVSQSRSHSVLRHGTPMRQARKRMLLDESEERSMQDFHVTNSAKGDIEVADVCPDGSYVKIHNKGKKEISLSGWQLLRRAGGQETTFKFHRSVKVEPNGIITVWSSDAGRDHEPPHNLVMKSQKWFVNDNMTTVVINSDNEEVAESERQRLQVSTSAHRHREFQHKIPRRDYLGQAQDEEKCRIM